MQTVELAFEVFGDLHSGIPCVILPGFFASSRNWRAIARQLAAQRPVYVLDMRNHGVSPHHPHMDYPAMAADVAAFLDKMQFDIAHLLGHSMGGKTAMWFALHYPERVEALIVADISPVSYQHSFDKTIQALKDLPLNEFSNRKQAEEWLAFAISDLTYRQFLLQNVEFVDGVYRWRVNLDFFQNNAHYIVAFPDTGTLDAYDRPALFLAGEHSQYIQREAIFQLFPKAVIHEITGAGHWLHADAPQLFVESVEEWLGR